MTLSTAISRPRHLIGALLPAALAVLSAGPVAAQEMTSGRAPSNGLGVYYEVHGDLRSDEVPFLVLHGGMGTVDTDFGDLLPKLAQSRPVIGIEQQGHGRTGGRDSAVTLATMRADTLAVLDELGVERVHVVGFSIGGMLAIELGIFAPERLATLTALSASQNLDGMHPVIAEVNRNPQATPSPEALELMPTAEDFAEMQKAFVDNPDGPEQFQRTGAQLQAFMISGWGWSDDEVRSISVPTLMVLGDQDFMSVEHVARMTGLINGAQLGVLPDTTHISILRRTDWLVSMIENRVATAE